MRSFPSAAFSKMLLVAVCLQALIRAPLPFLAGFVLGFVAWAIFHLALFHFSKPLFKVVFSHFVDHFDIRKDGELYLRRYYLMPRIPHLRRYFLHNILREDNDRDPHDHPWPFETHILSGCYIEHVWFPRVDLGDAVYAPEEQLYLVEGRHWARFCGQGSHHMVPAVHTHKIEIVKECWTLFATGPQQREWGFWKLHPTDPSQDQWIQHNDYLAIPGHGEEVCVGG